MGTALTKAEVLKLVQDADTLLSDASLATQLDPQAVDALYAAVGKFIVSVRATYFANKQAGSPTSEAK